MLLVLVGRIVAIEVVQCVVVLHNFCINQSDGFVRFGKEIVVTAAYAGSKRLSIYLK